MPAHAGVKSNESAREKQTPGVHVLCCWSVVGGATTSARKTKPDTREQLVTIQLLLASMLVINPNDLCHARLPASSDLGPSYIQLREKKVRER